MSEQGNITNVISAEIDKERTALVWQSDKGYHGQIVVTYNGKGGFNINAEYVGIKTISDVLSKWQEK